MSNHEHDEKETVISELSERLLNGIVKENPTFVLLLGMCPTLAVTTSAKNGLGMGVTTMVVLALSNLMISALRKVIPNKIRIPAFIVIIASFVTIVELLLKGYIPSLYDALGLYIPLIVVNCIILGRAEAYAYSHRPLPSLFDGIGMGMGFTFALTIIGSFREILGAGEIFGKHIMPSGFVPVSIFIMAPGAFFVLAALTAIQNAIKIAGEKKGKDMSKIQSGCGGNCLECNKDCKEGLQVNSVETVSKAKTVEKKSFVSEAPIEVKQEENIPKEESFVEKTEDNVVSEDKKVENEHTENKPVDKKTVEKKTPEKKTSEKKTVEKKTVEKKNEVKKPDEKKEDSERTVSTDSDDTDFEVLDLTDYQTVIKKVNPSGKKPVRKKASIAKAQAMLEKAEETMKEDENND